MTIPPDLPPDLGGLLETVFLAAARILPIVVFTPILGGNAVPRRLRIAIAIALAGSMAPMLATGVATAGRLGFFVALVKESLIGGLLAATVLVLVEALASAGELMDLSRGATFGNTINPLSQQPIASVLSPFFQQSLVAMIASMGGLAWIASGIAQSFTLCGPFDLGPAALGPSDDGALRRLLFEQGLALAGQFLVIAVLFAAPVLVAALLIELCVGALGRLAPPFPLGGLANEVKSLVAIMLVVALVGFVLEDGSLLVLRGLSQTIDLLRLGTQGPT